jgi:serine/threonine protein kinase
MGLATRTRFDRSQLRPSNRHSAEWARVRADAETTLGLDEEWEDIPTAHLEARSYEEPTAGIASPPEVVPPSVAAVPIPPTRDLPEAPAVVANAPQAERAPSPTAHAAPRDITTGTLLCNRYVLGRLLGAGGSSLIFQAEDRHRVGASDFGNRIAIKVLRPEMRNNSHALTRLRREFRQMQRLSHPGIARVFELGCDEDVWFMTMELVEGQTINHWLKSETDRKAALRVIAACCEALHHAHEAGVVHGDLKPSNVLVLPSGGVKLVDFGSAADRDAAMSVIDKERSFAATPPYASPQVLAGEVAEPRDDVFSLACLAYTVLTHGAHPFERKSSADAFQANMKPAYARGMSSREFDTIVRALSWDREQRPATVQAFLHELLASDLRRQTPPSEPRPKAASAATAPDQRATAPRPNPAIDATPTQPVATNASSPAAAESAAARPSASERNVDANDVARLKAAVAAAAAPPEPADTPKSEPPPADPLARFKGYVAGPLAPPDAQEERDEATGANADVAPARAKKWRWPWQRTVSLGALLAVAIGIVAMQFDWETKPVPRAEARLPQASVMPVEPQPQTPAVEPETPSTDGSDPEKKSPEVAVAPKPATTLGKVSFTTRTLQVGANQTVAALSLQRLDSTRGRAKVRWTIEGGTAQRGIHYAIDEPQVVEFLDGQSVRTLFIPLRPDNDAASARHSKTFTVKLQQVAGGPTLGEIKQVYVTIVGDVMQDHSAPTFGGESASHAMNSL